MSHAVTKLLIYFTLPESDHLEDAIGSLPQYSQESFKEDASGKWHGDFVISCPAAPLLAEGDIEDDFAPHFPALLKLKKLYNATFELQVAVGSPGPEDFVVKSFMLAIIAALEADLVCTTSTNPHRIETE